MKLLSKTLLVSVIGLGLIVSVGLPVWALLLPPQLVSPALPIFTPVSVSPDKPLVIRFDRPISPLAQGTLTPPAPGTWQVASGWLGFLPDRLIFTPAASLDPGTEYTVSLASILPLAWLNRTAQAQSQLFVFPTASVSASLNALQLVPPTPIQAAATPIQAAATPSATPSATPAPAEVRLKVPLYKQHHTFTCYSVAAKMALAFYGTQIDEIKFLDEIGYDSTPRNFSTNTWGNPNQGIVGTYNGSGSGGYGVHWQPVAKAMSLYRPVEIKTGWNVAELLTTVASGQPVMVWWVNGVWPAKDVSWNTPKDGRIYTVNGMHVEVVTGFTGTPVKPGRIYTNDPWRGQRSYSPETFASLWRWFNQSAVIVR